MRRNFILSESEIRQLVKKTLLNEQGNRTIQELQTLLANKGFTEVGTADNKAGQNTLSALNRALNLGLNLYRPQAAKQNTQTNTSSVVKNPNAIGSETTMTAKETQAHPPLAKDTSVTQGKTQIDLTQVSDKFVD